MNLGAKNAFAQTALPVDKDVKQVASQMVKDLSGMKYSA